MMNIEPNKIYSIYICGIGGQGIISLSKKIIDSLVSNPNIHTIVSSESRGVSQREGMVSSIIRFYYATETDAIIIPSIGPFPYLGQSNIFIGLDIMESLRNLKYLAKNGVAIINDNVIYPKNTNISQKQEIERYILGFEKIIREFYPKVKFVKKNFNKEATNIYENVVLATNLIFRELQSVFPTVFLS